MDLSHVFILSDAELENRLQEAGTLHRATVELCQQRASRLQKALDIAEHLHSIVSDISSQLNQIRSDSVTIHNTSATIQHQISELQASSYRVPSLNFYCSASVVNMIIILIYM